MPDQNPEDLFIDVEGINTRYWEIGADAPPIVFVHGLGGFIENWELNIPAFSKYHHVFALDLVGCGLSDKPLAKYSIEYLAEFVKEFMVLKNIEKASLIGASLGAGIVIEFSFRWPESVNKLILAGGLGFGRKLHFVLRLNSLPYVGERIMAPNRDGLREYLQLLFHDQNTVTEQMVDFFFAKTSQPGAAEAYLATLRSAATFFGMREKLVRTTIKNIGRITAPTLVAWGNEDAFIPVEQAYIAKELLSNATLHIFEKCGHFLNIECADEFNEIVLNFLE
jgi:4,5:9,10-diseco-3-hydroxy-5,9,17-trioxoandrosta-1(10),2-diene-4-oate hydrolase